MSNLDLKSICLLPLMVVTSLLVFAGSGHIFTSGKLSSSLINCVAQDRYGYIWVGTEYGLNKFDGYNFSSYLLGCPVRCSEKQRLISPVELLI